MVTSHANFDRDFVRRSERGAAIRAPEWPALFGAAMNEVAGLDGEGEGPARGSGPGVLSHRILGQCGTSGCYLVDFSIATHERPWESR